MSPEHLPVAGVRGGLLSSQRLTSPAAGFDGFSSHHPNRVTRAGSGAASMDLPMATASILIAHDERSV